MNKILIVVPSFNLGGTASALVSFLTQVPKDHHSFYVYAINNDGPLMATISEYAKIIGYKNGSPSNKKKNLKLVIVSLVRKIFIFLRTFGIDFTDFSLKFIAKKLEKMEFDKIIAFQEGTVTWLVSRINNPHKIAWVRSEYSRYLELSSRKPEESIYNKYEIIVSVSKFAVSNFVECLPSLKEKTVQIYDILDSERIINLSKNNAKVFKKNFFTIISIGRLDPVKRFSYIPQIAASLMDGGHVFTWFIIGGSAPQNTKEEELLKNNIIKNKVEKVVKMLGPQSNPYTYLTSSDLLVSLSSSETFNYTLTEALILGVPVVSTNYPCAYESISNNQNGRIVPFDQIGDTINELMTDKSKYEQLKNNVRLFKYDNSEMVSKIMSTVLA